MLRGQHGVLFQSRATRRLRTHTFSFNLSEVLPRLAVTAPLLWQLLVGLLAGGSLKAARRKNCGCLFALETAYRLRRSLRPEA